MSCHDDKPYSVCSHSNLANIFSNPVDILCAKFKHKLWLWCLLHFLSSCMLQKRCRFVILHVSLGKKQGSYHNLLHRQQIFFLEPHSTSMLLPPLLSSFSFSASPLSFHCFPELNTYVFMWIGSDKTTRCLKSLLAFLLIYLA